MRPATPTAPFSRSRSLPDVARLNRLRAPLITAAVGASAVATLRLRDPHTHGSWGYCPSYYVFGVYCPLCGGLRAVNDLSNGHVIAAAHSNLLFVASLPLIAILFVLWVTREWTGRGPMISARNLRILVWTGLAIALVFTIVRNLPLGAALAP